MVHAAGETCACPSSFWASLEYDLAPGRDSRAHSASISTPSRRELCDQEYDLIRFLVQSSYSMPQGRCNILEFLQYLSYAIIIKYQVLMTNYYFLITKYWLLVPTLLQTRLALTAHGQQMAHDRHPMRQLGRDKLDVSAPQGPS